MNIHPIHLEFGRVHVTDLTPPDTDDDHSAEGSDTAAKRDLVDVTDYEVRDDTEQFERVETRVFERWLRRFGKALDYWIWSGER